MEIDKKKLKVTHFIFPLVLLIIFLNPVVESYETLYQWLFMLAHYSLFIGGLLLTYRLIKGTPFLIIPSGVIAVFWHLPMYFNLAAAFTSYRILNDLTLVLAGILAGIGSGKLSLLQKFSLIIVWMTADTAYSIVFLLENPAYSNVVYSFSPYTPSQEINTAVVMWIIMSIIIAYIAGKFLKELLS
ncbi:DUF1404 domain-containing protein [Sulfurisphaera tokodaii]|uniref:DUF1404 domain-containing protein n=2 Tax=Sulfurisphaera tokodaii TaxID=111955 RepID=Q976Q2_SULTO|nr:DUF1404 domain-containing protein [Sulfurisphaera tokodaii]BAB65094.1 hypothetical protein STK_01380 [Sulfurisphaera tokodaii str. 7]HII74109.1 DUF1404 domain-containing protein [Sulfurisphaera tokodaii]